MSRDDVRDQYEAYPYPARDPADEARRLVAGSPSHLLEVNHYVFGGRRDFAGSFRALVAGGGTGDGAIMLAQQLAAAGDGGEVVHIDISEASMKIAEARAKARGLGNIEFRRLGIEELPEAGLGVFDYIDCCGVLHHLEDPAAGLRALCGVLAGDGGLGMMLYGELGRTGVYAMQEMLRTLAGAAPLPERVKVARALLERLPDTNWLGRNPFLGDHLEGGDAGLVDLFLHSRDRAYRVPGIAELVAEAGLRVAAFVEPARYRPESYLNHPRLLDRLAGLTWIERCAFAELLAGNMGKHVFYALRQDNPVAAPSPDDPEAVPRLYGIEPAGFTPGGTLSADIDGLTFRFPLPPLAAAMVARMDGARTIGDIHRDLATANPELDRDAFAKQFAPLYEALNGLGKLFLGY